MKKHQNKIDSIRCKNFYLTFLLILTLFMGIGYASVNSVTLQVNGKLASDIQTGIYITSVDYLSDTDAIIEESKINSAYQTMINSTIVLSEDNEDSFIAYSVSIYNSTKYNYRYVELVYDNDFYDNDDITFELSNLSVGDTILSRGYLNFIITFKYIDGVDFEKETFTNVLNSYLRFKFECDAYPVLANNMVPVSYNNGAWIKTDVNSRDWHDYLNGQWANALTYNNNIIYNKVTNNSEGKVFNGSSDYVVLGDDNYDFGNIITVIARVKLNSYSTSEYGIVGSPQQGGFYLLKNGNNKFVFEFHDSNGPTWRMAESSFVPELNTWYTLVGTYDGSNLNLYIDGVLDATLSISSNITVSPAPIVIGGNPNSDYTVWDSFFDGTISEVLVMHKTLTANEIEQNYGSKITHKPDTNNTLYYIKFDGDDGYVYNSASYEDEGMSFDGVDDFVDIGYAVYDFENSFSVGARVKLNSYSDLEYGIIGNPQDAGFYLLKSPNNKFEIIVYNTYIGDYLRVEAPNTIELNKWYTIVATCDSSSLKLYVDGVLVASGNTSINYKISMAPIMLGVNSTTNHTLGGGNWDGMISDVLLVDEVLTETQISQYYSTDIDVAVSSKTLLLYDMEGYEYKEDGNAIPDEMINAMWTWIPRFDAVTPTSSGPISLGLVTLEEDSHEAFNFDLEELSGFWIGKFENSANIAYEDVLGNITIVPNKNSLGNFTIGKMFRTIQSMITQTEIYGFDGSSSQDAHLIKNNEWGAVAYFTQSKYGLCTSGTCNDLVSNDTTYIAGGTNYVSNVEQSTTGNISGVYDLNGGVLEYVMGNYNNEPHIWDGFDSFPDTKYYNVYTTASDYTLNNYQHALVETNTLFNNSSANFVSTGNNVWFIRDGLFSYLSTTGGMNNAYGSRSVLVVK